MNDGWLVAHSWRISNCGDRFTVPTPASVSFPSQTAHGRPLRFNLHRATLGREVVWKTAPRPLLGPFAQTALDRVAMDVSEFLDKLLMIPHVAVVVTSLPEAQRSSLLLDKPGAPFAPRPT